MSENKQKFIYLGGNAENQRARFLIKMSTEQTFSSCTCQSIVLGVVFHILDLIA